MRCHFDGRLVSQIVVMASFQAALLICHDWYFLNQIMWVCGLSFDIFFYHGRVFTFHDMLLDNFSKF